MDESCGINQVSRSLQFTNKLKRDKGSVSCHKTERLQVNLDKKKYYVKCKSQQRRESNTFRMGPNIRSPLDQHRKYFPISKSKAYSSRMLLLFMNK
ncbi:unnamed protein product [Moneuplotes crassus]|uniref:Uncharacterized protein n=1 Tax=Euplotes crassus TaxID=5936 RepID=A0AAD1XM35_EUPCR|nr:unnamed protein product [Moneuplotes crassus]CAI2375094.1 unnamed protein product [Moneuplotes crassus]